jgi:hypothetical protein
MHSLSFIFALVGLAGGMVAALSYRFGRQRTDWLTATGLGVLFACAHIGVQHQLFEEAMGF